MKIVICEQISTHQNFALPSKSFFYEKEYYFCHYFEFCLCSITDIINLQTHDPIWLKFSYITQEGSKFLEIMNFFKMALTIA